MAVRVPVIGATTSSSSPIWMSDEGKGTWHKQSAITFLISSQSVSYVKDSSLADHLAIQLPAHLHPLGVNSVIKEL